jgi:3-methyladenine DNA glycosylase AlkD
VKATLEAPTAAEIVDELHALSDPQTKKTHTRHGAVEPFLGVKIEHLKKIKKRIKKNHELALELYETGISDARYLASLIADDLKMTKKDLQRWVKGANWSMISEYAVPWVAAESRFGWELGLEWIDSKKELIASAGWATLSSLVSIKDDDELDIPALKKLLKRVETTIHDAPNRVRGVMNCFVIAVGCYVKSLKDLAIKTAEKIGTVCVDMGDTSCKVPFAPDYIRMVEQKGRIGKKRMSAKC